MKSLKHLSGQILRFGVVGGLAFVIDFGVLKALVDLAHWNYLIASAVAFTVSVVFNYILSIFWVFDVEEKNVRDLFLFIVLSVIGLGITELIMWILVEKAACYYLFSKVVATAIVMVYNFITRKLFLE